MRIVHADGVFTGTQEILDGAVALEGDRVHAVGSAADVASAFPGAPVQRVNGVVFPGLVNAHTHVELSVFHGAVPSGLGFVGWVDRFMGLRGSVSPEATAAAIERAAATLAERGTVAVGDITNGLSAVSALAAQGLGGWVFHELFGLGAQDVAARYAAMPTAAVGRDFGDLAYHRAPHTLHTLHPSVLALFADEARTPGARLSVHLAEHPGERRLLEHGDGPMADWLLARTGARVSGVSRGPVAYAGDLGLLRENVMLVHLTDATGEELDQVATAKSPVVLCPRSNVFIEGRLPDVRAMLRRGIEPALGTDSLASNDTLDVLDDAALLRRSFPDEPASIWLQAATRNGARALGLSGVGELAASAAPGVYAIEGALEGRRPADFVLDHRDRTRRVLARRSAS
ncbi:MAG: amidohydrolase family protein [Polyangiaceae bacterium]|nr:amidohydrolase family protein [Polyangiaceae bacterium]